MHFWPLFFKLAIVDHSVRGLLQVWQPTVMRTSKYIQIQPMGNLLRIFCLSGIHTNHPSIPRKSCGGTSSGVLMASVFRSGGWGKEHGARVSLHRKTK